MASRFWCGSRTKATPSVIASSAHCRLGRDAALLAVRRRGRPEVGMPSAARARSKQVGALGLVELQRPGERVEHAGGGAGDLAALEAGVVLDAEPGE